MANNEWVTELESLLCENDKQLYSKAFSAGYKDDFNVQDALRDIELISKLSEQQKIAMRLYRESSDKQSILRFRIARRDESIALSDILPILENFGFRVIGERPYQITNAMSEQVWLYVFELAYCNASENDTGVAEVNAIANAFETAFQQVWQGNAESDLFNRLVLSGNADWRAVVMLRGYSKYMKQLALPYTRSYTAKTLAKYADITSSLIHLFDVRFNPAKDLNADQRATQAELIEQNILSSLDAVENLTEDQIFRQYLTLIQATLRTNFYQSDETGQDREYLSYKFDVNSIPDAPKPRPQFEIFVYSPQIEGVHLRGGKVARGGLRWSDRDEDFRTEVLGLVKAQQVKNSVIVPMGAKGGFICKQAPSASDREAFLANGIACYRTFISALLQLTDNLVDGSIVPPKSVVRWDGDDPYLVVAADKGTATFSDIANEISEAHNFWLGDAFASGGSVGYDHKKMGITAKGAWVSVQRHFREMGVNVQEQDFSVVAVGDMAGDVFGNGMLCSEHICLVAAFNHQHIFIDPNPDAASSYAERKRLFELPRSNWEDYESSLISSGGGIFSRAAKSIPLSDEIKQRFSITENELTPNEFIHAILKADVDLFWNGGIGTYVKSSKETHADVGDRANDSLRVNGTELGASVFGEGGNLGCTQLARVEYTLNGGRCNTDFIDNAGGVDCSDHEVNIKILLNQLLSSGSLDDSARNECLYSMTEEVSKLVLHNNYRQTQAISLAETEAGLRDVEYQRLIGHFENQGILDRELEFIPADDELHERKAYGKALTRPELSVLVSYAKLSLKQALANSDVANDAYLSQSAYQAFPAVLQEQYSDSIDNHQLHNEIVATQIAGDLVNRMGIAFMHRMQEATGESAANTAKAYIASRDLFKIEQQWQAIEALDYSISSELQHEMFSQLVRLVRRSSRWLLRNRRAQLDVEEVLASFGDTVNYIVENIESLLFGDQLSNWQRKVNKYIGEGVPAELAQFVASSRYFYTVFSVANVVAKTDKPIDQVAACYATLGERLELNWFADQIMQMGVDNYWQAMARESFRDELENQQATLVLNMVSELDASSVDVTVEEWMSQHQTYIDRWQTMTAELRCITEFDLAIFPVAIRELLDLSQASGKAA